MIPPIASDPWMEEKGPDPISIREIRLGSILLIEAPPAVEGLIFMPLTFTRVWLLLDPLRNREAYWPSPPLLLVSIPK